MKNVLILSAGLGTRLRPITLKSAKPTIPVAGVPMLGYPLFYAEQIGINNLCINTHYLPETVKNCITDLNPVANNVIFNHEDHILGSGGALLAFKDTLLDDDEFFVINGDNVFLLEDVKLLQRLSEHRRSENALASVLVTPHPDAGVRLSACWVDSAKDVSGFGVTSPDSHSRPYHYVGIMCVSKKIFMHLPRTKTSNLLHDVLVKAIRRGSRVVALVEPNLLWLESGKLSDFFNVNLRLLNTLFTQNNKYSKSIEQIITRFAPHLRLQSHCGTLVLRHKDSKISEEVTIKEFSIITHPIEVTGKHCLSSCIVHSPKNIRLHKSHNNDVIY